jgi:hypothetical protein
VAQLFALAYRSAPVTSGEAADLAAGRALAVILDGLRTGGHGPLPGRPLDTADLERR